MPHSSLQPPPLPALPRVLPCAIPPAFPLPWSLSLNRQCLAKWPDVQRLKTPPIPSDLIDNSCIFIVLFVFLSSLRSTLPMSVGPESSSSLVKMIGRVTVHSRLESLVIFPEFVHPLRHLLSNFLGADLQQRRHAPHVKGLRITSVFCDHVLRPFSPLHNRELHVARVFGDQPGTCILAAPGTSAPIVLVL